MKACDSPLRRCEPRSPTAEQKRIERVAMMQHASKSQSGESKVMEGRCGSAWRGISWSVGVAKRSLVRQGNTGRAPAALMATSTASRWMSQTWASLIEALLVFTPRKRLPADESPGTWTVCGSVLFGV